MLPKFSLDPVYFLEGVPQQEKGGKKGFTPLLVVVVSGSNSSVKLMTVSKLEL